ncbi:hypothetical protein [Pseudomonas fluorescens]|uniref:hypothetical protein n=1 Tax=Pseudomonas fluorescens TaxID=294 RepID=UPI00123FD239|nr:hypothetical protein [Pseudomonas fluorescens]
MVSVLNEIPLETSLLAMTIITDEMWAHREPCGSWFASDASDASLTAAASTNSTQKQNPPPR